MLIDKVMGDRLGRRDGLKRGKGEVLVYWVDVDEAVEQ